MKMDQTPSETTFMEPQQLRDLLARDGAVTVIDVRSAEEFASGHVEGAINIPLSELAAQAHNIPTDLPIVTVCSFGGQRSCGAAHQLQQLGHENVRPLRGGLQGWRK